jgi:hypothetical protein
MTPAGCGQIWRKSPTRPRSGDLIGLWAPNANCLETGRKQRENKPETAAKQGKGAGQKRLTFFFAR